MAPTPTFESRIFPSQTSCALAQAEEVFQLHALAHGDSAALSTYLWLVGNGMGHNYNYYYYYHYYYYYQSSIPY